MSKLIEGDHTERLLPRAPLVESCRDDFLEILLNWQKCPEAILYEAQWDFYWGVQALARGRLSQSMKDLQVEGLEDFTCH